MRMISNHNLDGKQYWQAKYIRDKKWTEQIRSKFCVQYQISNSDLRTNVNASSSMSQMFSSSSGECQLDSNLGLFSQCENQNVCDMMRKHGTKAWEID